MPRKLYDRPSKSGLNRLVRRLQAIVDDPNEKTYIVLKAAATLASLERSARVRDLALADDEDAVPARIPYLNVLPDNGRGLPKLGHVPAAPVRG
jgi:hypothetical protein